MVKPLWEFNSFIWWMQMVRRVAASPQTKPTDLDCESASRLLSSTSGTSPLLMSWSCVSQEHGFYRPASIPVAQSTASTHRGNPLSLLFVAYSGWSFGRPRPLLANSCVELGVPWGRFQDTGGFCIAAHTARRWTLVGCAVCWLAPCRRLAGIVSLAWPPGVAAWLQLQFSV